MAASTSAKLSDAQRTVFTSHIKPWCKLISDNERYYLPKAIDLFIEMSGNHQMGLLRHICEKVPNERWQSKLPDNTQYLDVIRSMLYYYTGSKDLDQPSKEEFKNLIASYIKSPSFEDAERSKEVESFHDLLEDL
jgi:hypothetical protein